MDNVFLDIKAAQEDPHRIIEDDVLDSIDELLGERRGGGRHSNRLHSLKGPVERGPVR